MNLLAAGTWTVLFLLIALTRWRMYKRERSAYMAWAQVSPARQENKKDVPAAFVLADVVARLRSGLSVEGAWQGALTEAGLPWRGIDESGVPRLPPSFSGVAPSIDAACRVTHEIGAPLAHVLESVMETIDEVETAWRDRQVARAGPETTAKILTALPLLGVMVSAVLGIDPFELWLEGGVATVGLVVGLAFWFAGVIWARKIVATAAADERVDVVVMIDLLVSCLNSGLSIPHALQALASACNQPQFAKCATLLRLGAPFSALEDQLEDELRPLIAALRPAWTLGASPTPMLDLVGKRIRSIRKWHAKEEAERLAVKLVLPLGLFLLPAFVAISVVPIVSSISLTGLFNGF